MGTLRNGILGGIRGKVGPVVGAKWRNLDVLKARPKPTTKDPKEAQVYQRSIFGMVNSSLKGLKKFIKIGFQSSKKTMSPMNAAVQYSLRRAVSANAQTFYLDYSKVKISLGPLPVATNLAVLLQPNQELSIAWSAYREIDPAVQMERDNDKLMVAIYDPFKKRLYGSDGIFKRSDLSAGFQLPLAFIGIPLHIWFFFTSESGKLVSDSVYLGSVTVTGQIAL